MVAPFPSVSFVHLWNMVIRANVVEDLGMAPNCFFLILAKIAGFTCSSTTNSSAIFDIIGVSEIGRRSLFMSFGGFFFGIGTMSAVCFPGRKL